MSGTIFLSHIGAIIVFCLIFAILSTPAASLCEGKASIRSEALVVEVNGSLATFQPIDSVGNKVTDFLNVSLRLNGLAERNRYLLNGEYVCDWASVMDGGSPVMALKTEEMDCVVTQDYYFPFDNDTKVDFININYTSPEYPDFWMSNNFYATSDFFIVRPSNDTQFVEPGKSYTWQFAYETMLTASKHSSLNCSYLQSSIFSHM